MVQVVKCSECNKRLMDLVSAEGAEVEIKCTKCSKVMNISMTNNEIRVKAV